MHINIIISTLSSRIRREALLDVFFKPRRHSCSSSSYLFIFRNALVLVFQRHKHGIDELVVFAANRAVQTFELISSPAFVGGNGAGRQKEKNQ